MLFRLKGRARLGLVFALCVAGCELAVISLSSTKLPQYSLPADPFLAAATAIAAWGGFRMIRARPDGGRAIGVGAAVLLAGLFLAVAIRAATFRLEVLPARAFAHQSLYGELFSVLARKGVDHVTVVDGGVDDVGVPKSYSPQLRFYTLLWASRGLRVDRPAPYGTASTPPGSILASCDMAYVRRLTAQARDFAGEPGCAAIRIIRPQ
jgi:hypothetical protein